MSHQNSVKLREVVPRKPGENFGSHTKFVCGTCCNTFFDARLAVTLSVCFARDLLGARYKGCRKSTCFDNTPRYAKFDQNLAPLLEVNPRVGTAGHVLVTALFSKILVANATQ